MVVGQGRRMDCIDGIDRIDGENASGFLLGMRPERCYGLVCGVPLGHGAGGGW